MVLLVTKCPHCLADKVSMQSCTAPVTKSAGRIIVAFFNAQLVKCL